MIVGRRGFIAGLAAIFAAPAIVRVEALMPIRGVSLYPAGNLELGDVVSINGGRELYTISQITREAVKLWVNSNAFIQNVGWEDDFAVEGAKIGSTLRIRSSQLDVLYGSMKIRPEWTCAVGDVIKDAQRCVDLLPNVLDLQLPAPVAIAAGVVAVAAKNPVVSRRFWSRAA